MRGRRERPDRASARRTGVVAALLLSAATLPTACGGTEEGSPPGSALSVTVDTTAAGGVRIRTAGELPAWRLEPEHSVEVGTEGSEITSLAVDRTGSVWVADTGNRQIRVYGTEGGLIRLMGRPGEEPGQFGSLRSIAFLGNLVLALDPANERVAELSPGGTWLGERPASGASWDPVGEPVLRAVGPAEVYQASARSGDTGLEAVWIRHGPDGILGSRPAFDVSEGPGASSTCRDAATGLRRSADLPLLPRWIQHPAPGGLLAVAWTGTYRVAFLNAVGDTVRVLEREAEAVPLTDAEWNAAVARFRGTREQDPDLECEALPDGRPASKPPLRSLAVDVVGRTWVGVHTPGGGAWDVYDSEGRPLGRIDGFDPGDGVPPYLAGERVAWLATDSLGVERVTVARILR